MWLDVAAQNKTGSALRSPFRVQPAGAPCGARGRFSVHVEVEVLLLDLLVGAVLDHVGDRLVDLRLQIGVFLAHADAGAVAEDLRIVEVLADEHEALAARRLQEALLSLHRVLQRCVQTTRDQVGVDLVLVLIRHDFRARRFPVGLCVGFLDRALFDANRLALQRFGGRQDARALLRDEARRRVEQLRREGDLFGTLRRHRHRRQHAVELLRLQRRDHAVEVVFHPHALRTHAFADFVAEVDIEANELAVRAFRLERGIAGINAKTDRRPIFSVCAN
jgi:hypothetical protein